MDKGKDVKIVTETQGKSSITWDGKTGKVLSATFEGKDVPVHPDARSNTK